MQSVLEPASKWILIHRYFGLLVVAVFLGTGMFMRFHEPPMEDLSNSVRVLYRSAHIYLLMSGLLNFAFGLANPKKETIISRIGSIFLFIAPVLIFIGFCLESPRTIIDRPITAMGVYLVFAGSLIRGFSIWRMLRFIT